MTQPAFAPRRHWRLSPAVFATRPKLAAAAVAGLAVGLAAHALDPRLSAVSCAIAGWDTFCALYLGLALHAMAGKKPEQIRQRAAREDQGQAVILVLILAACAAALVAAGMELSLAHEAPDVEKALRVSTAFITVTLSWFLMQVVFTLHYAHEYYAADPETREDAGGLSFPGGGAPTYGDFLHFAVVVGVAAQTADIAFTARRLRRIGTWHSLIAFAFNTLIVALTINLLAGLFP